MSSATAAAVLLCAQVALVAGTDDAIRAYRSSKTGGVSGNSVSYRGAAVPMTLTFAYDGIAAWHPSLSGALHSFPPHYVGKFQIATPNHYRFPGDGVVEYDCPPASAGVGDCDVVVFLYECYPCVTLKGGLPQYLAANGYQRSRCAPVFTVKAGGYRHKMTAFVKTIAAGTRESIAMPGQGDVEFVAFGLSNGQARPCGTYADKLACEGNDGHCVWSPVAYPSCSLATCVQKGPGGCDRSKCPKNELY